MQVILPKLEFSFGETLTASVEGVVGWAAVLLKNPTYQGHELHGSPVLLTQSGLPNESSNQLSMKLQWGGFMQKVVAPGTYLLRVWGFDSGNLQSEQDTLIKIL